MEPSTECRFVRWVLIVSIVLGMSCIVIWSFSSPENSQNDVILGTEIAVSGFGEIKLFNPQEDDLLSSYIYQDTELGFQISKPDNGWEIHSAVDELSPIELSSLQTKGFVNGIYIEKNHSKQFMLTIFDIKKESLVLHEFVDQQISLMESQNFTVLFEQVSPENNWALFAAESDDEEIPYGEQLLFLKDDRLYMLQYSGISPQALDPVQKNNFRSVMDSFEVI